MASPYHRTMFRHITTLVIAFSLCGCVQSVRDDAGPDTFEAGAPSQPLSGNTPDAGGENPIDASTPQPVDAGGPIEEDAGVRVDDDAGEVDAGEVDAGEVDAGESLADDAGSGVDDDAGQHPVEDAGTAPLMGTFESPILINTFPTNVVGNTTAAPSSVASTYTPCAPSTNESGGEFVYVVQTPSDIEASVLTIRVDDVPQDAVDIDLHLLDAPTPTSCFARDNREVSVAVGPDETVYVAADTWTNGAGTPLAGPFVLSFSLSAVSVESCFENPAPQCTSATVPTALPLALPGIGGCPAGMTPSGNFCVDVYEASLVEVLPNGMLAAVSPFENPGNKTVRAVSAPNVPPQAYISGQQAAAACANANKRLCSESEWERACQGSSNTTYPYGNVREPGRCNDARTCHPAMQYFESSAQWVFSELDHPCINQLPSSLDATGANPGCQSEDGAYDMMGNLHEWIADSSGVFRGGYYVDTYRNGEGCLYRTRAHAFSYSDYSTGFRCCADPL